LSIPIVSGLYKFIFGHKLPLPQVHIAMVRMGVSHHAPKSDTWTSYGTALYSAYNTQQIFLTDSEMEAPYSYLPPIYFYKEVNLTWRQKLRLTKIYLRKFNRFTLIIIGFLIGLIFGFFYSVTDLVQATSTEIVVSDTSDFKDYKIIKYSNLPNLPESYVISNDDKEFSSAELIAKNYRVFSVSECLLILRDNLEKNGVDITCK
jgi:hypothetical protein